MSGRDTHTEGDTGPLKCSRSSSTVWWLSCISSRSPFLSATNTLNWKETVVRDRKRHCTQSICTIHNNKHYRPLMQRTRTALLAMMKQWAMWSNTEYSLQRWILEYHFIVMILWTALAQRFHQNSDISVTTQPPSSVNGRIVTKTSMLMTRLSSHSGLYKCTYSVCVLNMYSDRETDILSNSQLPVW